MKVLVTGSAGFIGSFVVERLLALGHKVIGIDSLEPRVHHGRPPKLPQGDYEFIACDVANTPYWAFAESEVVIHLAAQVGVADSMLDPTRYLRENTLSTARFLWELARKKPKRLVVASSMSVYGEGGLRVREGMGCFPTSVYGLSKFDQERLALMWGQTNDVPVMALRFFNVFGPRQALSNPYTGVLANFAARILAGQRPIVYEDGLQTRDFVYVEDVADAVLSAALGPTFSYRGIPSVFNICTGNPTTIIYAATALARALGRPDLEPDVTGEERPGDIRHCTGDPTRAQSLLAWYAQHKFEDGIEKYAKWLLEAK